MGPLTFGNSHMGIRILICWYIEYVICIECIQYGIGYMVYGSKYMVQKPMVSGITLVFFLSMADACVYVVFGAPKTSLLLSTAPETGMSGLIDPNAPKSALITEQNRP